MSMADLHDLAGKLHDLEEKALTANSVRPEEFGLLAKAILQAVQELSDLEQRLRTLEGKLPNPSDV